MSTDGRKFVTFGVSFHSDACSEHTSVQSTRRFRAHGGSEHAPIQAYENSEHTPVQANTGSNDMSVQGYVTSNHPED